jgi:hypothetical protein
VDDELLELAESSAQHVGDFAEAGSGAGAVEFGALRAGRNSAEDSRFAFGIETDEDYPIATFARLIQFIEGPNRLVLIHSEKI